MCVCEYQPRLHMNVNLTVFSISSNFKLTVIQNFAYVNTQIFMAGVEKRVSFLSRF